MQAVDRLLTATPTGYWTGFHGWAASTVEWCETNYEARTGRRRPLRATRARARNAPQIVRPPRAPVQVCAFVAEFFNSVSSLAIVLAGVLGIVANRSQRGASETRFFLAYLATIVVGLGSITFHMTLLRPFQILDEVPMLYSAAAMTYCVVENDTVAPRYGRMLPAAFAVHLTLVTLLVSLTSGGLQFTLFHISFGSLQWYSLVRVAMQAYRETDPALCKLYRRGFSAYGIALVCWGVDIGFCDYLQALRPANPQLHAWWHVFVSIGLYTLTVCQSHRRLRVLAAAATKSGTATEATIEHVFVNIVPVARLKNAE
jgi:dihydroceramidase